MTKLHNAEVDSSSDDGTPATGSSIPTENYDDGYRVSSMNSDTDLNFEKKCNEISEVEKDKIHTSQGILLKRTWSKLFSQYWA